MASVYQPPTIGSQPMAPGAATVLTPSLRYWRSQRALLQAELAKQADVGIMSVHRGEAGQPLQLVTVRKLAAVLGVTPADLQRPAPES
ncbi:MAG TPA: helix-turn-helix transcriptional regulator [Ktedonobacterales bacterium]|nr:helix-turn-helix transcriptional regulator [Ktedonobacterales bacterium]